LLVLDFVIMTSDVVLGEVTCPSGQLVIMDGGYLEMWSGDRVPADEERPATDFAIMGPDAEAAGRSFDRQTGTRLYDIPAHAVAQFTAMFDEHCREHGHDASVRAFEQQVPHRERVRHAVAAREPGFIVMGVPVLSIEVPDDRALPVTAVPGESGWRSMRIEFRDAPVADSWVCWELGVDHARFVFADADALNSWEHTRPLDGLADLVLWGRDQEQVAAEFGAPRLDDSQYGWVDLPVKEAYQRGLAIETRREEPGGPKFAFDFRPHSHHWQVMGLVRACDHEAGVIQVGGADILMAMTSVGDGFFPVHLDVDTDGVPVALRLRIDGED
jgi:predicted enzyme related to lactoylglutathione lyase